MDAIGIKSVIPLNVEIIDNISARLSKIKHNEYKNGDISALTEKDVSVNRTIRSPCSFGTSFKIYRIVLVKFKMH